MLERFSLLSLSVTIALAGHAMAQDDCSLAVAVSNGVNGPFSNVGSTTSVPGWPCGAGANDVWFSYLAPNTGSVLVTTCGAGYDSTLEVFDGTGGCGNLVSLGCNDDYCGLQSGMTVAVTAGTTYFVRVGGFGGATGSFPLNIGSPASVVSQGLGCVASPASFYELLPIAAFDLTGSCLQMINTGAGYFATVTPGGINPVGSLAPATALTLTDDSQTIAGTLGISVGSNCWIALGTGNSSGFTPDVPTFLNNPATAFYSWKDLNPTIAGSGQVQYEELGTLAQITYDGVFAYATTTPCTIQFNIDTATGNVNICWGTMATTGTDVLVGHSPGGPSIDPGSIDLTATPAIITPAVDTVPLSLTANSNPVQGPAAVAFDVTTNNIPASALMHVGIVGLSSPGLPLGVLLGATGCYLNASADILVGPAILPGSSHTWTALNLPALPPSFAGFQFNVQGAILGTPQNPALGLGLLTSNGLTCTVGDV